MQTHENENYHRSCASAPITLFFSSSGMSYTQHLYLCTKLMWTKTRDRIIKTITRSNIQGYILLKFLHLFKLDWYKDHNWQANPFVQVQLTSIILCYFSKSHSVSTCWRICKTANILGVAIRCIECPTPPIPSLKLCEKYIEIFFYILYFLQAIESGETYIAGFISAILMATVSMCG